MIVNPRGTRRPPNRATLDHLHVPTRRAIKPLQMSFANSLSRAFVTKTTPTLIMLSIHTFKPPKINRKSLYNTQKFQILQEQMFAVDRN